MRRVGLLMLAGTVLAGASLGRAAPAGFIRSGLFEVPASGSGFARQVLIDHLTWVIRDVEPRLDRVVFDRGGHLFISDLNGSHARRVVRSEMDVGTFGRLSPDGRRVAFVSESGLPTRTCSGSQLWVVGVDGTGLRRLARCAREAAWSPDSRRIAFVGGVNPFGTPTGFVSVVDLGSSQVRRLTARTSARELAWSPVADRVAYVDGLDRQVVRVIGANGRHRLVVGLGQGPSWSPDGTRLAFFHVDRRYLVQGQPAEVFSIRVVNLASRTSTILDRRENIISPPPAWSPDGRSVAYVRNAPSSGDEVFVAPVRGGRPRRVTHEVDGATFFSVAWSADGHSVIYQREQTA